MLPETAVLNRSGTFSPMSVQGLQEGERLSCHFRLQRRVIDIVEQRRGRGRLKIRQLTQSDRREGYHRRANEKKKTSAHECTL